jgi:uncharacterized protein YigE (DUF2233 family)
MIRRLVLPLALLALAACSEQPAGEPVVRTNFDGSTPDAVTPTPTKAAVASACSEEVFEDVALTHCVADPAQHRITMANLGADKQPYGTLSAFAATVQPADIAFAINGGMYGDDLRAVGYYVEKGERLGELDRGTGEGNFYMKPNGVFFGTGGKWQVLGSNTFFNTVGDRPQFGTQSGPLLLVDGKLHPEVQDDGPSKAIRNAVGVDASGKAHFVISNAPISFGQLARYFRDVIKVSNALYLDGQVSSLWDPAKGAWTRAASGRSSWCATWKAKRLARNDPRHRQLRQLHL